MKPLLAVITLLTMAIALMAADDPSTYVDHEKVAAALAKGGPLVTAQDLLVSGSHRTGPGQVEVHEKQTDIIYVIDGEATFVTGGAIVGSKTTSPGQFLGTQIRNGQTHHLTTRTTLPVPTVNP